MAKKAKIIGWGSYLPEKILSNSDLEKIVDTSDDWIVTRTGMKERRIAGDQEFSSDMGLKAARKALKAAGVTSDSLDLILVATITPDHVFPSNSCLVQAQLGASNAAAMDIQAACSGYLYALSVAKSFIESGSYRKILVIASEKLSSIVDYEDRNTCVLFGDGATACVVSDEGKGLTINEVCLGADGNKCNLIQMPAGGSKIPASMESVKNKQHYIQMNGKEVFKNAVRHMESASRLCLERANIPESKIKWLVPHQANMRIIQALAKRFELPMERVFVTIHKYGNTSASSLGIALGELLQEKEISPGDHILLAAFGAGLTWGASVLSFDGDEGEESNGK